MKDKLKKLAQRYCSQLAMRQWLQAPQFCRAVEIETINRCNGVCGFCPVNRNSDSRPLAQMEDALLERVLLDLQSHDYAGFLGLQSNNEPLMDSRIAERIALARQLCLKAHLYLYTNGTLLTYERLLSLFEAGLDSLVIDNYSEDLQMHPHIRNILSELEKSRHAHLRTRIKVSVISPKEIRLNRGGQAPNKQDARFLDSIRYHAMGCMAPFNQLVIRPTGEVSLCCQDALGKYTMGNAKEMTLDEIWYGPKFMAIRRHFQEKGRKEQSLCGHCDVPPISRTDAKTAALNIMPWRKRIY
jgi:Predicted Fe-S oxidoreductases